MALIVEGKMPTNCGFCIELRREGNGVCWCNRMQKQISEVVPPYDKRMEWCPIIGEIPDKHGDLVSRDSIATALRDYLLAHFGERLDEDLSNAIYAIIAEAETIVVASE